MQQVNLIGQGAPERIKGAIVTGNLFAVLGVQPLLGRSITPADDREAAPLTTVLSYGLWQRSFGGDAGVLGQKVNLDGVPYQVIGIMPPSFASRIRTWNSGYPSSFRRNAFADRNNNYHPRSGPASQRSFHSAGQSRNGCDCGAVETPLSEGAGAHRRTRGRPARRGSPSNGVYCWWRWSERRCAFY